MQLDLAVAALERARHVAPHVLDRAPIAQQRCIGFDAPPTLMMTHNPPYYGELLEAAGLHKVKDLWAYQSGDPAGISPLAGRLEGDVGGV